jgi:hypothetical protein
VHILNQLFLAFCSSPEKKEIESKSSKKSTIEAVDISPPRETSRVYKARAEDSTAKKTEVKSKSSEDKVRFVLDF